MLWLRKLHFYSCDGVACGTPAFLPFTTPAGAAISVAPIYPEVAERVLITLLTLEATLEILWSTMDGRDRVKNVLQTF